MTDLRAKRRLQDTGETAEQHLWIELNREWLIKHYIYKSKRTKDEADLMLYMLFQGCREIRRPPGRSLRKRQPHYDYIVSKE